MVMPFSGPPWWWSPGGFTIMAVVPSELHWDIWKWALIPAAFHHRGEVFASPQNENHGPGGSGE